MKTPVLFTLVLTIHGLAISSFLLMQGCTTRSGISARSTTGSRTVATATDSSVTTRSVPPAKAVAAIPPVGAAAPTIQGVRPVSHAARGTANTQFVSTNNRRPMPPRRPGAGGSAAYQPPKVTSTTTAASKSWTPKMNSATASGTFASGSTLASGSTSADGSTVYVIKKGDVLSRIAFKHGVSTKELAAFNNLATPDSIRADQKILIPARSGATPKSTETKSAPKMASKAPTKPAAPKKAASGSTTYTVQKGDSLSLIAYRHGTTVSTLRAANQLSSDRINVGDELAIVGATKKPAVSKVSVPVSKPATPAIAKNPIGIPTINSVTAAKTGSTAAGERVHSISIPRPNSTKTDPLINSPLGVNAGAVTPKATGISVPMVKPAAPTVIETPTAVTPAAPPAKELEQAFEYVVQDGESIDDIARAFIVSVEDVRKLNKLGNSEKVRPGQTLKIPPSIF